MLREKGLPLGELRRLGLIATGRVRPKEVLNGFDYDAIWANPYLALDDAKYNATRFVDFPDEVVEVARGPVCYDVFGAEGSNAFVREVDLGAIRYVETRMNQMWFVNTDLRRFVRCFCFWQSLVWDYRAAFPPDTLHEPSDARQAKMDAMAERLRAFVAEVDPAALEDPDHSYWALIAFWLGDLGITLYPFILHYMENGRFAERE